MSCVPSVMSILYQLLDRIHVLHSILRTCLHRELNTTDSEALCARVTWAGAVRKVVTIDKYSIYTMRRSYMYIWPKSQPENEKEVVILAPSPAIAVFPFWSGQYVVSILVIWLEHVSTYQLENACRPGLSRVVFLELLIKWAELAAKEYWMDSVKNGSKLRG